MHVSIKDTCGTIKCKTECPSSSHWCTGKEFDKVELKKEEVKKCSLGGVGQETM